MILTSEDLHLGNGLFYAPLVWSLKSKFEFILCGSILMLRIQRF